MEAAHLKNRSRGYQCRRCGKVMRKAVLIGHILKQHVTLDRVPFSCSLCSFRCQDKEVLLAHVTKYQRHVEAEVRLGCPPNYADVFRRAENPYHIDDKDMIPLTKEESRGWRSREVEIDSAVFEEEDEEDAVVVSGGLTYPTWIMSPSVPQYNPTPKTVLQTARFGAATSRAPNASRPPACQPNGVTGGQSSQMQNFNQLQTFNLQEWEGFADQIVPSLEVQGQPLTATAPVDISVSSGVRGTERGLQVTSKSTPLSTPSPQLQSTPCRDENILPGLLGQATEDPLYRELGMGAIRTQAAEEPAPKKARTEAEVRTDNIREPSPTTSKDLPAPALEVLAKTIQEGFQKVAKALEDNTRAIRCQEKTFARAADELQRIERKLSAVERTMAANQTTEAPSVPTKKPTLKSVVSKKN